MTSENIGIRHPNYKKPEDVLKWGFKCSTKAKNCLKNGDVAEAQKAIYDVREAIKDALFLIGFRGEIET